MKIGFPIHNARSRNVTVMIYDKYNRPNLNLRISVTQECDKHCPYCHREGESFPTTIMTVDEIIRIVKIALNLGISRVKITGGEPLLRREIVDIVSRIHELEGLTDLSMTTNGTNLKALAKDLKKAGLSRINVSLPTLNPTIYCNIMGGKLQDAIEGVKSAVEVGMNPVKLNMLLLRNVNDAEINDMISFAKETNTVLQLIELEPINLSKEYYDLYHLDLNEVSQKLEKMAKKTEVRKYMHKRRIYNLPKVKVELIRPIENTEFCANCTRIRITSDGKLKPCLMRKDNLVDLLKMMRNGFDDKKLTEVFFEVIKNREPYYKAISSTKTLS